MPKSSSGHRQSSRSHPEPHLNEDVLRKVLSYASEGTLWRTRRVSRGLKMIADAKLKPFLATQRVLSDAASSIDIYDHDDRRWRKKQKSRYRNRLEHVHARFAYHLDTYPPASSRIRHMSLELREDTLYDWPLLGRIGPQLISLQLVIHDELEWFHWEPRARSPKIAWDKNGEDWREWVMDDYDSGSIRAAQNTRNLHKAFAPILSWSDRLDHSIRFPLIRTLSLIATARVVNHFVADARHFPNLVELTLACPWADKYNLHDADPPIIRRSFPSVTHLVVTGRTRIAVHALSVLHRSLFNVKHLVFAVPINDSQGGLGACDVAAKAIFSFTHLEQLAVYGCIASALMEAIRRRQIRNPSTPGFEHLRLLAVERDVPGRSSYYDYERRKSYPLMDQSDYSCPRFPALRSVIFADRRSTWSDTSGRKKRKYTLGSEIGFEDFFEKSHLQSLFSRYSSLEHAFWIRGYPADPLAINNDVSTWAEQGVMCGVRRYEGDKTGVHSNHLVLYIPAREGTSEWLKARRMLPIALNRKSLVKAEAKLRAWNEGRKIGGFSRPRRHY